MEEKKSYKEIRKLDDCGVSHVAGMTLQIRGFAVVVAEKKRWQSGTMGANLFVIDVMLATPLTTKHARVVENTSTFQ